MRCGACLAVCPVYRATGIERHAPRGKQFLLSENEGLKLSAPLKETIAACLQCGACGAVCSAGMDVRESVRRRREDLPVAGGSAGWLARLVGPASCHPETAGFIASLPGATGIVSRLAGVLALEKGRERPWLPAPARVPLLSVAGRAGFYSRLRGRSNRQVVELPLAVAIFSGCLQNFIFPDIAHSMTGWFKADVSLPSGQVCCGLPAFSAGDTSRAASLAARNMESLGPDMPDIILTGCASCADMLRKWHELPGLSEKERRTAMEISERTREFAEFVLEFGLLSEKFSINSHVTAHVPCHERYGEGRGRGLETLVREMCGDMFMPSVSECCGHGGSFALSFPSMSRRLLGTRMDSLAETGAGMVVTNCSGCLMQLRYGAEEVRRGGGTAPMILHVAEIMGKR